MTDRKGPEFDPEVDDGRLTQPGVRLLNLLGPDQIESHCQMALSDAKELFEKYAKRAERVSKGDPTARDAVLDTSIGALIGMVNHMLVSAATKPAYCLTISADTYRALIRREVALSMSAAAKMEAQLNAEADKIMRGSKS